MRHFSFTLPLLAVLFVASCSENLGPAPPDGGSVVRVREEGASGPRTPRAGTVIAGGADAVFVGTDAGLFRFVDPARWTPVHGGFLTSEAVSRAGAIRELAVGPSGRRILFRGAIGPSDALVASGDGGELFERLERPDALLTGVDAIGIHPAGSALPDGGWLAVQGGRAFSRGVGVAGWSEHLLPRAPVEVAVVAADPEGRLGFAVAATGADDWTLWSGRIDEDRVGVTGIALDGRALALVWSGGGMVVATRSGVHGPAGPLVTWPDAVVEHAALDDRGGRVRWSVVGRRADASLALASGEGPAVIDGALPLAEDTVVGVSLGTRGARVLFSDAATSDGLSRQPYAGTEVDLFSLGVRPGTSTWAVGHTRTGEIYQGPASDPGAYSTRGTPLRASAPRAIVFDPEVPGALLVGSFGVYRSDPLTASWQDRNTGFFSYDPGFFAGPFPVSAFEVLPDGDYWVGGVNGDGPYRSTDGAASWQRVHAGLGEPGSWGAEPGLPLVTQVQAFAAGPDGAVWMGGFRGGVFRLDPSGDAWERRSEGLPQIDGVPLAGCCPEPGVAEVDVRDLVVLGDGSLLAATGWGVYRLRQGETRWELRSTGLFNRDVQRLLGHPADSSTVLAATRGRAGSTEWLFLSEDAGRTWFPVSSRLSGRVPVDLAWSDPSRMELVVLLEAQGLWRMELDP